MARKKRISGSAESPESGETLSRSAKKRESTAMQKIGENLIRLKPEARMNLPITEDLREALDFYDTLSDKEALRRQRQYIGKLMREVNTPDLLAALEKLENPHARQMAKFHAAERWREKILKSPDISVEEFLRQYKLNPDRMEKEDLVNLASRASQAGGSDPALKRALFRLILAFLDKSQL